MAQQIYAATNALSNAAPATTSVVTTYPVEYGGGCLGMTAINSTELHYDRQISTPNTVTSDGSDLFAELQNFIALMCRLAGTTATSQTGLNSVTLTAPFSGINGAATTTFAMTPRSVMLKLQQMLSNMLANPNV